jgi:HK97 family phage major capsid protein
MDHHTLEHIRDRALGIKAAAESEHRNLSSDEVRQLEALFACFDTAEAALEQQPGRRITSPSAPAGSIPGEVTSARQHDRARLTQDRFIDPRTGDEIAVLGHAEKLVDLPHIRAQRLEEPLALAKYVAAHVTGNWGAVPKYTLDTFRAQQGENVLTAGGALVPAPLSTEIIDRARSRSVVLQAGARTIPLSSKTLDVARVTGDPTAYWRPEHAVINESTAALDRVTFVAKTLGCIVRSSIELLEDAPNSDQLLRDLISTAIAQEMDRVALLGTGLGSEPMGLQFLPGVPTVAGPAGALGNYAPFLAAILVAQKANASEPYSLVMSPAVAVKLAGLTDSTGQPLVAPALFSELNRFTTTKLTGGGSPDSYSAFLGDFSQLVFGIRQQINIAVDPYAGEYTESGSPSETGDAFERYQVRLRATARMDVQVFRANHIVEINSLETGN